MEHFIRISKYAGMRVDLVQGGGGNTSVKLDDTTMRIKASGFLLSEMSETTGYTDVAYRPIVEYLNDAKSQFTKETAERVLAQSYTGLRPSIETFLHSVTKKYTLHTHALGAIILAAQKNGKAILKQLFPEAAIVEYATPGVELAQAYMTELRKYETVPKIIFLLNHGLIISSDDPGEVIQLNEAVLQRIEEHVPFGYAAYAASSCIAEMIEEQTGIQKIVTRCTDEKVAAVLATNGYQPWTYEYCPDHIVYLNRRFCVLETLEPSALASYINTYGPPSVILYDRECYIVADSLEKARDTNDVLHLTATIAGIQDASTLQLLSDEESQFLVNWDAEKYRKNIKK